MSSSSRAVVRPVVLRGPAAALVASATIADLPRATRPPDPAVVEAQVHEAVEEGRAAGYAEGFAAGVADGRAQAQADAAALAHAAADHVRAALAALGDAAQDLRAREVAGLADVQDAVAALAFEVAGALVGRELELADRPGRDAVARALRLGLPPGPAVVRLHPGDLATTGDLADLAPDRHVTLVPDAAVERGGCLLEVGACTIDAQLGPALARVQEALCR